jgi:hypothetical protein
MLNRLWQLREVGSEEFGVGRVEEIKKGCCLKENEIVK